MIHHKFSLTRFLCSGFVAERVNLRYFLALGMLTSGFFTYLFGVSYSQGIHSLPYFFIVQVCTNQNFIFILCYTCICNGKNSIHFIFTNLSFPFFPRPTYEMCCTYKAQMIIDDSWLCPIHWMARCSDRRR